MLVIIVILAAALGYAIIITHHGDNPKPIANNTTTNNTAANNTTEDQTVSQSSSSSSGQYGYCAICGKALTYSEAHSEFTQGKVCSACAKNPYYQTEEGSKYANKKLEEAYPDEYSWMDDDSSKNKHHSNSKSN